MSHPTTSLPEQNKPQQKTWSQQFCASARGYLSIFASVLLFGLIVHLSLRVLSLQGNMVYLYDPPKADTPLESLAGLFTLVPLLGLLFGTAALGAQALGSQIYLASQVKKLLSSFGKNFRSEPLFISHLLWQLIGLLVSMLCMALIISGFLSKLQFKAILSKMNHGESSLLLPSLIILSCITFIMLGIAIVIWAHGHARACAQAADKDATAKKHARSYGCILSRTLLAACCFLCLIGSLAFFSAVGIMNHVQPDKNKLVLLLSILCLAQLLLSTAAHFMMQRKVAQLTHN